MTSDGQHMSFRTSTPTALQLCPGWARWGADTIPTASAAAGGLAAAGTAASKGVAGTAGEAGGCIEHMHVGFCG